MPEQDYDYFLLLKFADVGKNNYLCRHIGVKNLPIAVKTGLQ
jgi:hypothetical protein